MMKVLFRSLLSIAAALAWSAAAQAQDTPAEPAPAAPQAEKPQAGELASVQTLPSLNEEQRGVVRKFVGDRTTAIVNQTAEADKITAAAKAVSELRTEYGRSSASQAFREAYVAMCLEVIGPVYKSAKLTPATQLVSFLASLNELPASKLFIEALGDERPAVRAAAASGLRGLRQKLVAAGGSAANDAIDALRDAGKRETSAAGLQSIYAALNYGEAGAAADAKRNASAVLEILDARSEQYASKQVRGAGAETVGLALLRTMQASLSDAEKDRLIVSTARMLFYSLPRYAGDLMNVNDKLDSPLRIVERNQIEGMIDECERVLKSLMKPSGDEEPNLSRAIREPGKDAGERAVNIRNEAGKWSKLLQAKTSQKFEFEEAPATP
ncbi:MAG: hypothetical protein HZB38_10990 [Planctomycetes bacterium]|nr:hypothetical protein [Planctomycetota bacterium]